MAASIEVRVPFLDNEVLDLVLKLPAKMKVRGFTQKRILRQAMKGRLPDAILQRRKAAFGLPVCSWMRNELQPMMQDLLSEEVLRRRSILNPTTVRQMMQENSEGTRDFTIQLWSLMTLELWQRAHIDNPITPARWLNDADVTRPCGALAN